MLSGALTLENLSQALRDISQRKRQGVLEIVLADSKLNIFFVQGRIVEILSSEKSLLAEVFDWLGRAGVRGKKFSPEDSNSLSQIVTGLSEHGWNVSKERLKLLFRHRVLEHFYALAGISGGFYSFAVRMVEFDRDYSPSISVGQLLLDLVDIEEDAARFAEIFPAGSVLRIAGDLSDASTDEEREIMELLGNESSLPESELRCRAVLSDFHYRQAMLALLDQQSLEVVQADDSDEELEDLFFAIKQVSREETPSQPASGPAEAAGAPGPEEGGVQNPAGEQVLEMPAPDLFQRNLNLRLMESERLSLLIQLVFLACAISGPVLFALR